MLFTASQLYVSFDGNDSSSDCSFQHPCYSINNAISKASEGDTVLLQSHATLTYSCSTNGIMINKSIHLTSYPTATSAVFDCQFEGRALFFSDVNVSVSNITFRNGRIQQLNDEDVLGGAAIVVYPAHQVQIENCIFEHHRADQAGGAVWIAEDNDTANQPSTVSIINNRFINCSSATGGGGLQYYCGTILNETTVCNQHVITFEKNVFQNCIAEGFGKLSQWIWYAICNLI